MSLEQLEQEVLLLENEQLPQANSLRDDLFSISGHPHRETVLSNWFAYFLESDNTHGLSVIFGDALFSLITLKAKEKGIDVDLSWLTGEIHVIQEKQTDKKGFIDLLLYDQLTSDELEKETYDNALVVEHKVFAELYNNLTDYYKSTKAASKVGVVLSAKPMVVKNRQFVNITYQELIDEIKKELGKNLIDNQIDHLPYLFDFINNLKRMSSEKHTESLDFCFKHGKTINELTQLKKKAESELAAEASELLNAVPGYTYYRKNPYSLSLKYADPHISIVVEFERVFSEKKCDYQYWLYGESLKKWKEGGSAEDLKKRCSHLDLHVLDSKPGKEWLYLMKGTIDFTNVDKLGQNFAKELMTFLDEDLRPVNDQLLQQIGLMSSNNSYLKTTDD